MSVLICKKIQFVCYHNSLKVIKSNKITFECDKGSLDGLKKERQGFYK